MKSLDLSQPLKSFDGQPIPNGKTDLTLKDVLLAYLSQGHTMNLSTLEQGTAYELGMLIGPLTKTVQLEAKHYDILKKLCDHGKVRQGQSEESLFSLVVSQQAKLMVDGAETVKEEKAKKE